MKIIAENNLQDAIDEIANYEGGVVEIPQMYDEVVTIPCGWITLQGTGWNTSGCKGIRTYGTGTLRGLQFSNMKVSPEDSETVAIEFDRRVKHSKFENVRVTDCKTGWFLGQSSQSLLFDHCITENFYFRGMDLRQLNHGVEFMGCHWFNNNYGTGGSNPEYSLIISTEANEGVVGHSSQVLVTGCKFEARDVMWQLYAKSALNVGVRDNYFEVGKELSGSGENVNGVLFGSGYRQKTVMGGIISNNRFQGNNEGNICIHALNGKYINIFSNTIDGFEQEIKAHSTCRVFDNVNSAGEPI